MTLACLIIVTMFGLRAAGRFGARVDGLYIAAAAVRLDGVASGYVRLAIALDSMIDASNGLHVAEGAPRSDRTFLGEPCI